METTDGTKLLFADESWLLFRQSGTEPMLRVYAEARQRQADRVVEQYIVTHGLQKLSDDAERQIGRLLVKAGQ